MHWEKVETWSAPQALFSTLNGLWERMAPGLQLCCMPIRSGEGGMNRPPWGAVGGAGRATLQRCRGRSQRKTARKVGGMPPTLARRLLAVARLVELHREAARQLEVRHQPVAVVGHRAGELDAAGGQLRDGLL